MKQQFLNWIDSDNVIKTETEYKTQCSQYRKSFTFSSLYRYFVKEYC